MKSITIVLIMALAGFVFTGCAGKSGKINKGQFKKHTGIHPSNNSNSNKKHK